MHLLKIILYPKSYLFITLLESIMLSIAINCFYFGLKDCHTAGFYLTVLYNTSELLLQGQKTKLNSKTCLKKRETQIIKWYPIITYVIYF